MKLLFFAETESAAETFLKTALLGDVFEAVWTTVLPLPSQLVMKIDIELFECKAFLGSPEVLTQPQAIPLLAVIMEWVFLRNKNTFSEQCPKDKVIGLAKLFLENDYTPFRIIDQRGKLEKLDTSNFGTDWKCNVAWISNSIATQYL